MSHQPPSLSSSLTVREMPRPERPRERLQLHGPRALSTVELLAIILGAGAEGRSSIEVARDLIASAQGKLRRIYTRPLGMLTNVRGIGPARAITIHAALELGRRMSVEEISDGFQIRTATDIYMAFAPRLEDLPVEEFRVGVLDAQNRLESEILVSRGILNSSLAHPREVFRAAISENACSIVLVHNHPSGDPVPSLEDKALTSQLVAAGNVLGIPVVDHVIIGRGRFTSFSESGILI